MSFCPVWCKNDNTTFQLLSFAPLLSGTTITTTTFGHLTLGHTVGVSWLPSARLLPPARAVCCSPRWRAPACWSTGGTAWSESGVTSTREPYTPTCLRCSQRVSLAEMIKLNHPTSQGICQSPPPPPKNELSKQLMNQLVSQSFGPSVDQEFIGSNSPWLLSQSLAW